MSNSKLATEKYPAYSGNYTKGRSKKISEITIHHMAGVLTAKECGAIFQKKGRRGSSNYGIGKNGEIAIYVDEANTSWCNSNWDSNCRAVTIETSNSKTGGDWLVSDKVLNSLIKLVADIGKRNNLGTLVKGKNVTWHSMYTSTACPGKYLLSKMDYIVKEANKINNGSQETNTLKINNITNKKVVLNKDAELWNLDFKTYAEARTVKSYKKGDIIEVSAIATHPIGAKYYLTEYSYSNKINNGFNVVDCDDYVEVEYYKKYTGKSSSIVDALRTIGVDSSYNNRKKIAVINGITNYSGTSTQNTKMLNLLKEGKLIKVRA